MWKRQTKICIGCGDNFLTFKNYDYCLDCAINGNRYLQNSPCSECDGSGVIKFPQQKPRLCKLCNLSKKSMPKNKKLTAEEIQEAKEEEFWNEVDLSAQEKIYQLLTTNLPFQNIPLITEPWRFEDRQMKLTGLFLRRDVDYRTLLGDVENQYSETEETNQAALAEEITLWYCRMVVKALIESVSDYGSYDSAYFENLTN